MTTQHRWFGEAKRQMQNEFYEKLFGSPETIPIAFNANTENTWDIDHLKLIRERGFLLQNTLMIWYDDLRSQNDPENRRTVRHHGAGLANWTRYVEATYPDFLLPKENRISGAYQSERVFNRILSLFEACDPGGKYGGVVDIDLNVSCERTTGRPIICQTLAKRADGRSLRGNDVTIITVSGRSLQGENCRPEDIQKKIERAVRSVRPDCSLLHAGPYEGGFRDAEAHGQVMHMAAFRLGQECRRARTPVPR